jgi:hypothetical protein
MAEFMVLKTSPPFNSSPFHFSTPDHPNITKSPQQMLPDKRTLLTMNGEELIKLAKNPVLTKPFQEMIQRDIQVRQKLCGVLTTERVGADFLTQLAYDGTGNFIVQVGSG